MSYLGEQGYTDLARTIRDTTRKLREGIEATPELHVWGEPEMSVFAFGSRQVDIMAVGDAMDDRVWCLDRQQNPDALHLMVSPEHAKVVDAFLADLATAARDHGPSRGTEPRYS